MRVQFRPVAEGGEVEQAGAAAPGREAHRRASWEMFATDMAPTEARGALGEYARLAGLDSRVLTDVLLCVSEAVANVALHAYPDGDGSDTLEMDAAVGEDLCIRVRDRGKGFAPALDDATGEAMAAGLPIINRLARAFHIVGRASGGMEIVMRFDLRPKPPALTAQQRSEAVLPLLMRHRLRHARRTRNFS